MYYDQQLHQYLQNLHKTIHEQAMRIQQMDIRIAELEKGLTSINKEPRLSVDRIEYKFDQLKIERLDGTLNIGLTPKSGEELLADLPEIETGDGDGGGSTDLNHHRETVRRILQDINEYIQTDLVNDIKKIEAQHQHPLNNAYRQFIIEDIRKQIDQRVTSYLKQMSEKEITKYPDQAEQSICQRVKMDITKGIEAFIMKLKQGEEPSS